MPIAKGLMLLARLPATSPELFSHSPVSLHIMYDDAFSIFHLHVTRQLSTAVRLQ